MSFLQDQRKKIWHALSQPEFLFVFVAVWTAFVLFSTLTLGDLSGYDDAAYAHEARAMVQTNDWWTMSLNGFPDFDKPPLFIWLLAASFKMFGATDFAAKLPVAVLGWATVLTTYFLAKEIFSGEAEDSPSRKWLPALAMLSMATTQYFLKYSTHAMTDVPFTFFFALAVYFYALSLKNNKFLLACGIATGLATLTRSPMGLFPLAVVVLHAVFARRAKKSLSSFYFVGCVALAVLIPTVWFAREYQLFGGLFFKAHLVNFLAHSNEANARTGWQHFLWYFEYLFLIVRLYAPWFPLLFCGLYFAARRVRENGRAASAEILLIAWVVVVLVPFSAAESKILRYILPVFPAFAILSAYALQRFFSQKFLPKFSRVVVLLLTVVAITTAAFPNYIERGADMRTLAPVSDAATESGEKVWLYTSGEYKANFQTQLIWYGNRLCLLSKDLKEIETLAAENKRAVVIMDKPTFADATKNGELKNVEILAASENFVCFRT